jgi:RHS repeat-associated protein
MKTRLKLTVTAFTAVGLTAGAVFYFSRPSSQTPLSPEMVAAEKARKVDLARLQADGIRPPALKTNKTLSFMEKEATAKAKPTLHTSLINLDLSRPPTELELIQAGNLGDPLSPTSPADPAKFTDPAKKAWHERDNLAFGKAIQTWNEHRYDEAVKMFAQHMADYPESPWAGESSLHIGCAAQYRGEYDVCYEQFGKILDTTETGTDLNQKAQLRVANILTKQGLFEEAAQTYLAAMKTETDAKRMGYASSWLPVLSLYKNQQTAMRDCVQKSLQEVCLIQGREEVAAKVASMPAMREDGFTAAQVLQIARELGMSPQAVRVKDKQNAELPVPFLAHYKDEHFVAVFRAADDKVRLYDSRVGFQNEIPQASFRAQWSGYAITLAEPARSQPGLAVVTGEELNSVIGGCCGVMPPASPTGPEGEKTACATGSREPAGPNAEAPSTDPIANSDCSPNWAINPTSLNMVVRDVPMWWDSPYGLDVTFSFVFNSQDTLTAIRPAGQKWFLNYSAYAMEDPSGVVTIVAGNTHQWSFTPASGGSYTAPNDFAYTLVKTGTYEFQLTSQETGTVYVYGRPSGVSTSASLFLSSTDKWGVSVSMSHNPNGALTGVTHSIGGTWDLVYNTAGLLERIDDPFGRSAYFAYDTPGMLREMTDMGGLKCDFKYSTSANPVNATTTSQVFMTEIVYAPQELPYAGAANRTWHPLTYQFYTEPPNNNSSGMWARSRVTITQFHGGTEVYYFDGATTPKGWHQSAAQVAGGSSGASYTYSVANGAGHRSSFTFPGGGTATLTSFNTSGVPLSMTRRDGVALTQTVNSFEKPLTITDPASRVTTFEYESNGMDLKKITGPDSVVAVQVTYNSNRQPATVTRRDGTQVVMTYNSHGQPATTTLKDAAAATIQTTTYTYNSGNRVASVDVDGRTVASYTYDSIGRVATVTNEDSQVTTYTYDSLNRVTKVTCHDSTFTERAFHGIKGMVAWERDRDGQRTLYFYDQRGQMIAANTPGQRFYYWGYNNDGQMTLLIDPKGNRTAWEYDIEGRLVKKTLQDNAVEQLAWNTKSQMTQHTSPRGMKSIFTYDTLGRLTSTAYQTSGGTTVFPTESRTYDVLDRVATRVDGEGTTTYSFDSTTARLTSVDGPYGSDTVSYGYDDLGRVDEITTPGSITQSFTFDSDERLSAWSDVFGSGSITYSGRTDRVTNVSRAGGLLSTSFAYTAASDLFKLAQIKHEDTSGGGSVISQFDYTWNAQQDIATWTRKLGSTAARETRWELGHDAAHQLVSATLKQVSNNAVQADQRWGFDSIGNRTLEHDLQTGVRTEYSHNSTNQLVDKKTYSSGQKPWVKGALDEPGSVNVGGSVIAVKGDNSFEGQSPTRTTTITAKDTAGNTTTESWQLNSGSGSTPDATHTYTHDSEGNLLGDGTSTFEWDLRNRLTAIVTGTHRTEFTYDGSDRRVRVVEKESSSVTSDKRYVFNGLTLLEERASDNSTVLRRFYGSGHVDVADSGKRYAYTTDHLGSIREVMLLDGTSGNPTTATLAARYDYDLWGKRSVLDGGSAAETLVLHGYTGHVYHSWSGLWLAPYRAYSSGMGRWISRDPIAEDGGINLYAYVGNGAAVAVDPLGLDAWDYMPTWAINSTIGATSWAVPLVPYAQRSQDGLESFTDGVIPFYDPFADNGTYNANDPALQLTKEVGEWTRNAELFVATGFIGRGVGLASNAGLTAMQELAVGRYALQKLGKEAIEELAKYVGPLAAEIMGGIAAGVGLAELLSEFADTHDKFSKWSNPEPTGKTNIGDGPSDCETKNK